MATQQKRTQQNSWNNSFETSGEEVGQQVKSLGKDAIASMWEEFFKAAATKNLPEQVLNSKATRKESVLQEGQEISLTQVKQEVTETKHEVKKVTEAHHEYVRSLTVTERKSREEVETQQQVDLLQQEIKKLIKASKEMEVAFKQASNQVTVEQKTSNAGTYHVNFLEWVLLTIRSTRMRVEEGKNWMALFASKKGQMQYWSQAAKKGTSFTQHHDRAVATQNG